MTTLPRASHNVDPPSSRMAEEQVEPKRRLHIEEVLRLVRMYPGETAAYFADSFAPWHPAPLNVYEIRRRLSDLKAQGRVRQTHTPGERECRWWPAERQEKLL